MAVRLVAVMSDEAAELEVLTRANELGKFAVSCGLVLPDQIQFAFERGLIREWYRLIDISVIAHAPGLMRIFLLTDAGRSRLAELTALTAQDDTEEKKNPTSTIDGEGK